jgi:hypothetical protein
MSKHPGKIMQLAILGDSVFMSGDDTGAKATVRSLLAGFGWPDE